jgi:hypothetical protein
LLVFSVDTHRRRRLLQFAEWLEGDTGFVTVVRILEGEGAKMLKLREEAENELHKDIITSSSEAFPLVIVAPSLIQGIDTLVQAYGIGPLKANTILLNWFEHQPTTNLGIREILYGRRIKTAFRLGCNIVVLDTNDEEWKQLGSIPSNERRIDVWWWDDASSHLMLLLAYLITRSEAWENAKIRVMAPTFNQATENTIEQLHHKLEEIRIEAEPEIVKEADTNKIVAHSTDASLVLLPFRLKGNQPLDPFGEPLDQILLRLPITAIVLAAEDIELDAEPEAGKAGEVAAALDSLADAEKRAKEAEKDATRAQEAADEANKKLQQIEEEAKDKQADELKIAEIRAAAAEAGKQAEKAARRSAKAKTKAQDAKKEAEALGIEVKDPDNETNSRSHPK